MFKDGSYRRLKTALNYKVQSLAASLHVPTHGPSGAPAPAAWGPIGRGPSEGGQGSRCTCTPAVGGASAVGTWQCDGYDRHSSQKSGATEGAGEASVESVPSTDGRQRQRRGGADRTRAGTRARGCRGCSRPPSPPLGSGGPPTSESASCKGFRGPGAWQDQRDLAPAARGGSAPQVVGGRPKPSAIFQGQAGQGRV